MQTYEGIKKTLLELEEIHFRQIFESFQGVPKLGDCITGGIQFAALDDSDDSVSKSEHKMPVIGTFGISYSQNEKPATSLFPYIANLSGHSQSSEKSPAVEENTGCTWAVASMLSAYNRNTNDWTKSTNLNARGAKRATEKAGLQSTDAEAVKNHFIMFMVNRSPFITKFLWQDQVKADKAGCEELLRKWPNDDYLDKLFKELNGAVDLWIGHSARDGTEWVWPTFNAFVKRHQINEWLFTPNISSFTYSHVASYKKRGHKLYEFFKDLAKMNDRPNSGND